MGRRARRARESTAPARQRLEPLGPDSASEQRRWEQGRQAFLRARYADAADAWRHCRLPEAAAALAEARLRLALAARRPDEAVTHLEDAVRLAPDDALYRYHLGLALWRAGRAQEALDAVHRSVHLAPAEPRYRRHAALLSALLGQPVAAGAGWQVHLLSAVRTGGGVPDEVTGAPAWLDALLSAMRALARGDWSHGAAVAERSLPSPDLPPCAKDALGYCAALARAGEGRWGSVLVAEAGEPFAQRALRLRRTAAVHILLRALSAGDGPTAEAVLPRVEAQPGIPGEARLRLDALLGLAHARAGEWASAIRRWQTAARRFDLSQPLALAHERNGDPEAAFRHWERALVLARRGGLAGTGDVPVPLLASAAAEHLAELAQETGDLDHALRFAEESLGPLEAVPPVRLLEVARMYLRARPLPSPKWERAAELLGAAGRADPSDAEVWTELARLRRLQGRPREALEAGWRRQRLLSSDGSAALDLLEDAGRTALDAWQHGDWDTVAALAADVRPLADALIPPPARDAAELMADLILTLAERARGRSRRPPARWDAQLHGEAGVAVPMAAFALRGIIALCAGHRHRAAEFFAKVRDAAAWEGAGRAETIGLQVYLRHIGHAHCWARQVREGARGPSGCANAPACEAMRNWLLLGAACGPDGTMPKEPPPVLRGCAELPRLYRRWAADARALRGAVLGLLRFGAEGDDLMELLDDLAAGPRWGS